MKQEDKPIILEDTSKLSMDQILSKEKKRIKSDRFIPRYFKERNLGIVKIQSETKNKYIYFRKDPVYNYHLISKTTRNDLVEDLLNEFEQLDEDWFREDYGTEELAIKELHKYLVKSVERVNTSINDPCMPLVYKDERGASFFNYFQNSNLLVNRPEVPDAENKFPIIKEVLFNICERNQTYFDYVVNWFAYLYQDPTYKFSTSILFGGDGGTGKDLFARVSYKIFSIDTPSSHGCCAIANSGALNSTFKYQLFDNKLLVVANEISENESIYKFSTQLKEFITEEYVSAERKFCDRYNAINRTKWIFFTNKRNPFVIDETDRRFNVFCATQPINKFIPFETIMKFKDDEDGIFTAEVEAFCSYLNKYPVNKLLAFRPLVTPAKTDIIMFYMRKCRHKIINIMLNNIVRWKTNTTGSYFSLKGMFDLYSPDTYTMDMSSTDTKAFSRLLKANGFEVEKRTAENVTDTYITIPEATIKEANLLTEEAPATTTATEEEHTPATIDTNKTYTLEEIKQYLKQIHKDKDIDSILKQEKKEGRIYEARSGEYKFNNTESK